MDLVSGLPPSPLFERLEFIDDAAPHGAALNMAIDEVLLNGLADVPRLRVYRWERPAISFGYFEAYEPIRAAYPDHEHVRRWTGGGVVEHGSDLTYSLFVPRRLSLGASRPGEAYRLIHAAVAAALAQIGVPAELETDSSHEKISRSCFENPVSHDVLVAGRKVAGAAQRRTRRGLLHQGSIALNPLLTGDEPTEMVRSWLAKSLARHFSARCDARPLNSLERSEALRLVSTKYGSAPWLQPPRPAQNVDSASALSESLLDKAASAIRTGIHGSRARNDEASA